MQEKQVTNIQERLCQKRILVLGPESDMKQKFLQEFRNAAFKVSEDAENMSLEDYVILFGFSDRTFAGRPLAEKDPEAGAEGMQKKEDRAGKESKADGWETFSFLTNILRKIEHVRPESVLFVSRSDVYGKIFGKFHPVKEDEMGYVCHTNVQDQEASKIRMLENLCFRMAQEDGIPVKIVRLPDMRAGQRARKHSWQNVGTGTEKKESRNTGKYSWQGVGTGTEKKESRNTEKHSWQDAADSKTEYQDWKQTVELAVKILLDGKPGEAYNAGEVLPTVSEKNFREMSGRDLQSISDEKISGTADADDGAGFDWQMPGGTTALEPVRIIMDTGKAEKLG